MTFATDSLKASSERFALVKVVPRFFADTGSLISANTYTFSPGLPRVDSVSINGSTADVTSFTYVSGLLTVVSSLNLASSANVVTCDFNLFFSGTKARDTYGNTAGLPEDIWEPRIQTYPSWNQSISNLTEGIFSVSNTDMDLISTDRVLHGYFGELYSWYKAPVTVWSCIDTVNSSRVVFTGEVVSATLKSGLVNISIADTFQRLNQTASFGTREQSYSYTGNSFTTNVPPNAEGKPIPLVIGQSSPLFVESGYRISENISGAASTSMYHLSDGLSCVPVTANLDTATSVQYLCGRIVGTDLKTISYGTITAAYSHYVGKNIATEDDTQNVGVFCKLTYLNCSAFNGEIGDYITGYGNVCAIGTFTHAATTFNLAIANTQYFFTDATPASGSFSVPTMPTTDKSIGVWIEGSNEATYAAHYQALALVPLFATATYSGRYVPFTIQLGTSYTIGGESITHVYVTVAKANIGNTTNPGQFNLKCRFSPNVTKKHSEAMKFVLKSAGMTTNDTTFTDAATFLGTDVCMCIPSFGQGAFPSYLQVAQSIAASTLGIVRTNVSRECEYYILDDIASEAVTGVRDTSNILLGNTGATVEYQDIFTKILFENDNYKGKETSSTSFGPVAAVLYPISAALHRLDNIKTIKHVLVNIYDRKDKIADYFSTPKVEYTFNTSSEDLNTRIGDRLTFTNPTVAAASQTSTGMVVGIRASGTTTTITINELRGIN